MANYYLRREGDDPATYAYVEMPLERMMEVLTDAAAMLYGDLDHGPKTGINRDQMSKILGEYILNIASEVGHTIEVTEETLYGFRENSK